ncbi:MAG TPA: FKBP-type peptidyl-prolyl cis-trans isomerase [Spirochaetota bacterium]|jgi:FKBP-type peptidyl-prolyl cis-trans isomerase FkpA/FKBP-type peptidyl-prolyl cis-trans isomerase FklB|nr:FKBP-type peptidyl-prolyl cis-trans isomerase [Spirochaetota bacterium]OQA96838.1 MAG: Outer membrane protein MIP precursor [Spirochaetes bacterium ADurb.Bin218]HOK01367.1 FKBP-type peptidyl-prolyl cis-trans isomerase [Spirochaetota bacterium]HOK92514.1 FKBP-type peptidyl-prolyl cis-trans isomerase [Spirochaetota bacterium]HON16036.1 FKBP-type peptidyl-prolyl cis-trans isomerase [Spirochaetota bacterium]
MRSKTLLLLIAALVISTVACKKADLSTDKGKYSYAIGYNIGKSLKNDQVDLDVNSFIAALEDALKGKESSLTMEEAQQAIMNLRISLQEKRMKAAEENKAKGEAFLSQNKAKEGVHTTASGLQYRVLREGTGPKPKATDVVTVHYTGRLIDGTEFDSSYKRNEPAKFQLDSVIKGWTEGLQLMPTGSKYELVIPAELGYGPMGNQAIPGNSVLIFEVELLGIGK